MPSPSKLSAWGTALFAVASTIADLPTAVPYFAAASRIATLSTDAWVRYAWLFVYNLVYVGPLIAMVAASLALGSRAEGFLQKVRSGVDWTFARLLPPVLAIAGIMLVIDGIRRAI